MALRTAAHSGTWYSSSATILVEKLARELSNKEGGHNNVKYVISPHAGYDYSLKTAAFAYSKVKDSKFSKIFILGPSHHVYFRGCGLDNCSKYETPLGNLDIDSETVSKLLKSSCFMQIAQATSEDEHSIEMQLPILKYILESSPATKLVPIMVGDLDEENTVSIVNTLMEYFKSNDNLFVISSDFCHFGLRFDYYKVPYPGLPLHEAIEKLDKVGIDYILKHDYDGFLKYLSETKNTICGRNPIQLLLKLIELSDFKSRLTSRLERYDQSNPVVDLKDSSVSYAAIVGTLD